jgi:hypothetical protein
MLFIEKVVKPADSKKVKPSKYIILKFFFFMFIAMPLFSR